MLFNNINVELYPLLTTDKDLMKPYKTIKLNKDEVTWLSPK